MARGPVVQLPTSEELPPAVLQPLIHQCHHSVQEGVLKGREVVHQEVRQGQEEVHQGREGVHSVAHQGQEEALPKSPLLGH